MKMNTTIKTLCAAVALAASAASNASPFYLDVGIDYSGSDSGQVTTTSTSMKDEFTFLYMSSTTIQDSDLNGEISSGDLLSTDGGLAAGPLNKNQINGFNPNQTFGADSNNGYGNWVITFSITGLNGVVNGVTDGGVPLFQYGPGLLEMFITFDGSTLINFMDIAITGGGATGVSTVLFGSADFTNVDSSYNNLFHSGNYTCGTSSGFFDIWKNCGEGAGKALEIAFDASFDTNVLVSDFTYDPTAKAFSLTSNHDGSGTMGVPEPASLALIGVGLLGLGAIRRRKTV